MPNIMLTYNCNLNCPYCFANELVKSSNANITLENYVLALDFIRKTIGNTLGLIGGEPLLHPEFSQMLEIACSASEISKVVVFTNGILLDRYADIFKSTKTHVLINCNSPEDIGVNNFNMLRSNIRYLSKDKGIRERLRLGVNLYSTTKDYSYIFELLDACQSKQLRISLAIPDFAQNESIDYFDFFQKRKGFLFAFIQDCFNHDVLPRYDCNKPPYCIWTDNEKEYFESNVKLFNTESNIIGQHSYCRPVIDILPDLKVIRCFGLSDCLKINLFDYENIPEIITCFEKRIDNSIYPLSVKNECNVCNEKLQNRCVPGCMGFMKCQLNSNWEE